MAAVVASVEAVYAIFNEPTASAIMLANDEAAAAYAAALSTVVGPAVARLAGLDPASYTDMTAIAADKTAMAAVAASATARNAVTSSTTAKNALGNSPLRTSVTSKNWTTSYQTLYSRPC